MKKEITHRINAGLVAMRNQIKFFSDNFGRVSSQAKHDASIVTFVDFAITEKIFAELREQFAKDQFFSEESDLGEKEETVESVFSWLLDPVDGTENYALGMPSCAISLGLLCKGVPIYGWIFDFSRSSIYHGGEGYGVFQDSKKLSLPDNDEPMGATSLIALHFSSGAKVEGFDLEALVESYRSRYLGSGALSLLYTGLGLFSGSFDMKVKPWDIAGAFPILQASGRMIHFLKNTPFPMTAFHPRMDACPYFAGSPAFCDWIEGQKR